ncbi:MAG TPA: hypothetical protein ENI88_03660 [Desulfobulbus sp.]|nr:hypothetical protein [Desulfobulbus sp.]
MPCWYHSFNFNFPVWKTGQQLRLSGELLKEIRENTHKGMAVGNDRFKKELEAMTGRRLRSKKRGRLLGWGREKI